MEKTEDMKAQIAQLEEFIMKKCLWQFHSRAWDRKRQNERILNMTTQLLCDEPVAIETPNDRCYWVDAMYMVEAFKSRYPWINAMSNDDRKRLIDGLKERIDYLTITGSLNKELNDALY
ncbi:Fe-only nitrogenase, delta subunit [Chloroherpeton thalassium ATCC 35110]|uniref:Nitrogenase iron-iron protein delta chain n=1 Tax=Chloroherpeton thalassium (strain ATCC 35110 / GB-78) TaxID=517418 RepID=B3QTU1_CHLT3|nr:Fe-only nitrogenase subunit delta [Chloroherpeton thalassium]ACF14289.1 Fe-only nitrogenase, delta subunit [Chloroherpeton thalassium ATCC 35110]